MLIPFNQLVVEQDLINEMYYDTKILPLYTIFRWWGG